VKPYSIPGDGPLVPLQIANQPLLLGRSTAYELVRQHRYPLPVIRVGGRLYVRRAELESLLAGEASVA
jgi:hypothetical protein